MSVQRRERARHAAICALPVWLLILVAGALASPRAADLLDDLYRRGQEQNGKLRTFTAQFTETTTSTLLTKPLTARGTVAVERPARVALRYVEPDQRVVLIDGDRMTIAWPTRGVRQTRDIGASQKRVQKYFVDSSPRELRSHFDIAAAQQPSGYLVTMVPTRKQIKEGPLTAGAFDRRDVAADDVDEDDLPERRQQADDVHGRQAERTNRSGDVPRRRGAVGLQTSNSQLPIPNVSVS